MQLTHSKRQVKPVLWLALIALVPLMVIVATSVGSVAITNQVVWQAIANELFGASYDISLGQQNIIWHLRLPRSVLALSVGAGLACVGAALQALTRNPLADPHLLGVSSGAAFGAVIAILFSGMIFGAATLPIFAFSGAMVVSLLLIGIIQLTKAQGTSSLVLAGVAVSFIAMSLTNLSIFIGDPRATQSVMFWMLGSLGGAKWNMLLLPSILVCIGVLIIWYYHHYFDALTLGDEAAESLGINTHIFRLAMLMLCAMMTAILVAFSGVIGFVGLMVPHIARAIFGARYIVLIPASAILGAIFMLLSDIFARTITAPVELPIGVITGLVGGAFFLWQLWRARR